MTAEFKVEWQNVRPTTNRFGGATARVVRASASERIDWDDEVKGLGKRTRGASQTWILQRRIEGRTRKLTLGALANLLRDAARVMALDVLASDADRSVEASPSDRKILAFAERYLIDCKGRWRPGTFKTNASSIRSSIIAHIGHMDIADVTDATIDDLLAKLDMAPSTEARTIAMLSGLMKHAELCGFRPMDSNPCEGLRRRTSEFTAIYLTEVQYGALGRTFDALEDSTRDVVQMLRFLAPTGCRLSEART